MQQIIIISQMLVNSQKHQVFVHLRYRVVLNQKYYFYALEIQVTTFHKTGFVAENFNNSNWGRCYKIIQGLCNL